MENKKLIATLNEICRAPEPEGKTEFFKRLEEQSLTKRRPAVMSHGEFLLGQLPYIEKRIWVLSGAILLFLMGICYNDPGKYPFALTPLLAAGVLVETGRSYRWKMAELEYSARFSLRSVMLARMFLIGAVDIVGLLIVICAVSPRLSYSMARVFLYMMVPYLCASFLGSVYERKHRADHGWGSIVICVLSSAFFAAAPFIYGRLYEEKTTLLWAAAFVLLVCGLTDSMRKWVSEMRFEREEPVWS